MRTDEEELLIYEIRSGTIRNGSIVIVPATIDQVAQANRCYLTAFTKSVEEGLMTEQGLELWMIDNSILPKDFYARKASLVTGIDQLKKDLYNARTSRASIKSARHALTNSRAQLSDLLKPKSDMAHHTCEFIAQTEKIIYLLKRTTFKNGKLHKSGDFQSVLNYWRESLLDETTIRSLARSSTWHSVWNNRGFGFDIFKRSKNADLTTNQRNLLSWSKVYDNVQESLDCPDDNVISDDDMLDGWFLIQKEKREREKLEQELEKNKSTSSHTHVFHKRDDIDFSKINGPPLGAR